MADDHEHIKKQLIFGTGYGRPPKHTQFQKGQSGNRNGRPKKMPSDLTLTKQPTLTAAHKAASKTVRMREGDQVTEIPAREAVLQAAIASALKGSPRAQAEALKWFQEADKAYASEIDWRNAIWRAYKDEKHGELAEAAKRGDPPPKVFPHPDDIILDPDIGPRFIGPIDEEEQAKFDQTIECCELMIMQDALDGQTRFRPDDGSRMEPGFALDAARALNLSLPPRLRLSNSQIEQRQRKYRRMPKRELMKLLFRSWRKCGHPRRRGYVSPNVSTVQPRIEFGVALFRAVESGNIDPQKMTEQEFEEAVVELMARHGLMA